MKNIIVLGAGRVGSAIAADLQAGNFHVVLADKYEDQLNKVTKRFGDISTRQVDVASEESLQSALEDKDLVINAVPGHLGYQTLDSIINAEKDVVDISFFPENALDLDEKAKDRGVTAVVDCGVAPGMNNILLGYHNRDLDVTDFTCMVGGLPKKRTWPFAYKAPFSPVDVIEEYMRPARLKEHGEITVKEPLSEAELVEFESVGTVEAFNTDGLRTLLFTMPDIPNMKEKTLRYPGHIEYIQVLKKSGFFDEKPLTLGDGSTVSPREVTTRLLDEEWMLEEREEEITIMKVIITGIDEEGAEKTITYSLHDEYCHETGVSSMARTTGYTATAVANILADDLFHDKGIIPPEYVGANEECFDYILDYLSDRDVTFEKFID